MEVLLGFLGVVDLGVGFFWGERFGFVSFFFLNKETISNQTMSFELEPRKKLAHFFFLLC